VPELLSPGSMKILNDEKNEVNTKLLEIKDIIRAVKKTGDQAKLDEAKEKEAELKLECENVERRIDAIDAHDKNREVPQETASYTWPEKGTLGLRLQDTKEHGVLVSFVAKDARKDMPNLTGFKVTHVHDRPTEDKPVGEVVAMIQEASWPLTMKFSKGVLNEIDTDGDGKIDEEEMAKYMSKHGSSTEKMAFPGK